MGTWFQRAHKRGADTKSAPLEAVALAAHITPQVLNAAEERARRHGTLLLDEFVASDEIDPELCAAALASQLGAGLADSGTIDPAVDPFRGKHPARSAQSGILITGRTPNGLDISAVIRGRTIQRLAAALDGQPSAAMRLRLLTPQAFADRMVSFAGERLVSEAVRSVETVSPELSARMGPARWQISALIASAAAGIALAALAPGSALSVVLAVFSVFFLALGALRLTAVGLALTENGNDDAPPVSDRDLPVYTVLVPLYREANVVGRLIEALSALDYPSAKLDIKLIVEADDPETVAALRARRLPGCFEIVTVPDRQPKTKPKALNFALALARGSLITIFDAEDRPEPDQLRRAVARFLAGPPDLACLQARLAWYNWGDGWLTRQFAIEYASLFDVFLPALGRLDLPIPLGGTSNHFRAEALRRVGAWDAFNVTEDADLGIRLVRAGYRCATLSATTWEEAPNRVLPWFRQRTRWLKGWIITYMVHMRRPGVLLKDLGLRRFLGFQAVVGGVLASALLHPIFFAALLFQVLQGDVLLGPGDWSSTAFRWLSGLNLVAGYGAGFALGLMALRRRPMPLLSLDIAMIPAYWLLMSLAAYRAVWECVKRPFHWEKTTHGQTLSLQALPRLVERGARARRIH